MESRSIAFRGAGGIALIGDAVGDPSAPPALLLHGGGQTRHAWGGTARVLARHGFHCIAIDHRGHGDSGWPEEPDYNLETFATDVVEIVAQLGRPPLVIGASLGGLAALLAEGERGPILSGLVLVDVAPRLEIAGVQRVVGFMQRGIDGWATLDEAADAIAAYLPNRARPRDTSGLQKNLRQGPDGRWRWHWDPRFVRRDRGDPGWSRARFDAAAHRLTLPTLVVRGRMSDVLSEEGVRDLLALVPHAKYADVAGAAHMVAGDDNDAFTSAVVEFATQIARSRPAQ